MSAFAPCGDSGIQAPFICDSAISEGLQGHSLQPVEEKRESVEASGKCNLGVGVRGRVGKGWRLPLRDNPIVRSRVKVGVYFLCMDFWYLDVISASISVIFTCLPHPLYEISKSSVLLCFICPVLLISVILEPSTILGTEYIFIEYLG